MPIRYQDCCAFPYDLQNQSNAICPELWLQEAPVVLVIQPFAAEVQTHHLM